MEHRHAAVLRAIADGQEVEWRGIDAPWITGATSINPLGSPDLEWRIKPRVIVINGREVPEPYRGALKDGVSYYFPVIIEKSTPLEKLRDWGVLHLTPEAADLHEKALLSFTCVVGVN